MGNQKGLTILEVLISATILGIMGIGIVNITSNSIGTKEKVLAEDKTVMQLELALSILQNDFAQIYTPLFHGSREKRKNVESEPYGRFDSNERFAFATNQGLPVPRIKHPEKGGLEFLTNSNRRKMVDSKESSLAWVRYSLRPAEKEPENEAPASKETFELVRSYEASNIYSADSKVMDKEKSFVLFSRFTSLEFLFWNPKEKKFVEGIDDVPNGKNLLRAIKVKFSWMDELLTESEDERIFYALWPPFEEKKKDSASPPVSNEGF